MPPILGVSFGGQVLGLIRAIPVFSGRNRRDNVADYFSFPGNPRGRLMLGNAFHIVYSIKDSNNDARFFYLRHVFLPFHRIAPAVDYIKMKLLQGTGEYFHIELLDPFYVFQKLGRKFMNYSRYLNGIYPEVLLAGLAENLGPGKCKAPGDEENVSHVLRLPPGEGAEFVRQNIPPVIYPWIKRCLLKLAVV